MRSGGRPARREPIAGRVLVLCVAYACCALLQSSAETTTLSLFVHQLGASKLPMSYLATSLVDVPAAFAYMRLAGVTNRRWLLGSMAATLVALLGVAYVVESVRPGAGLFLGYVATNTLGTFLAVHWGVLLLDAFTVDESRRAFPWVYAGGHLGSFASGAILQRLAGPVHSTTLMVAVPAGACALLAVLLWLVGRMREGVMVREGEAPQPALALGATAWRSLGMLRGSRLLQAIAVATSLMVLLRLALRWLYGTSFEQSCSSTDALTRFLGGYTMVASVFGVMLQVVATPHLLRKLGVARLNVAYGLALLGAFGWLAVAPGAMSGAAGRFTDTALKAAIKTPLSAIFYDA
ncbi:MAG: hypothetical protein MUF54_24775, partial [Polyangiaceae bacterium]|nr:hypothetical protein [Polyangiaceae bacterium]